MRDAPFVQLTGLLSRLTGGANARLFQPAKIDNNDCTERTFRDQLCVAKSSCTYLIVGSHCLDGRYMFLEVSAYFFTPEITN